MIERRLAITIVDAAVDLIASRTDGSNVGVFFPIPEPAASEFPSREGHDDSPPHITGIYVGDVPASKREALVRAVGGVLAETDPVEIRLANRASYFPASENSDGCVVAKLDVAGLCAQAWGSVHSFFPVKRPHGSGYRPRTPR